MLEGIIKSKDILSHPYLVIQIIGIAGFMRLLVKMVSRKRYHFGDLIRGGEIVFASAVFEALARSLDSASSSLYPDDDRSSSCRVRGQSHIWHVPF